MGLFRSKDRRIFAIGDTHGCALELEQLLKKISPRKDDLVVFLGDYVDRGPNSRGVIDTIIDLSGKCEVVSLKGNHEAMLLDFLERPAAPGAGLFVLNGGTTTLANYGGQGKSFEFPESHIKFLRDLKLTYETDEYYFVHAGVPEQPLATIRPDEQEAILLWSRQPFLSSDYKWEKLIVHGHTPMRKPELLPNRINVDTGCVYDGMLTAVELPSRKFISVDRMKTPASRPSAPGLPDRPDSARISMRFSGRLPVDAGRPQEPTRQFETLNFNQYGVLMQETQPVDESQALKVGDLVEGRIGMMDKDPVLFSGTVVRMESRGPQRMYGVRIDRVSNGQAADPQWIQRPAG